MSKTSFLTYCFLFFALSSFGQKSYFKIAIEKDGVYKIDRSVLKDFGLSWRQINPQNLKFYHSPQKILPQQNTEQINVDWTEIPVFTNDNDGSFDKNDYIFFYAEGPDAIFPEGDQLQHKQHPYSKYSYILAEISDSPSKKIENSNSQVSNTQKVESLHHFEFYEPEFINLLNSGREWLGDYFFSEIDKSFSIPGLDLTEDLNANFKIVSQTYEDTDLSLFQNGEALGQMPLSLINYRRNDYYKRYNRAGEISEKAFQFTPDSENLTFTFQLPQEIDISSGAYIDYIEINGKRKPGFYPEQHQAWYFGEGNFQFGLNLSQTQHVWDISDPGNVSSLKSENGLVSVAASNSLTKLAFFDLENVFQPKSIEEITIEPIPNSAPELLIVYPQYFKKEAQLLADYRSSNDGLEVATAELELIYHQYSGGKTDPTAIRNYCRDLWKQNPEKFKYLLLFGDTNFDLKNNNGLSYIFPDRLIPTYESKESLEPIYSYSSDDYFGFLEDHEGEWPEGYSVNGRWISSRSDDHSLDIAVGRLPVKTKLEAQRLAEKLMHYDQSHYERETWKRKVAFVADDADLNIHQRDAEQFSDLVKENYPALQPQKIYLDAFAQTSTELGERSKEANEAFEKVMNSGALIVNFNGHGSEDGWTDEKLLTISEITQWRNLDNMPILFTATCEFGRYDNPAVVSGAELALLNPNGGSPALLTTTRPVFSSTNFKINEAFYKQLFEHQRLGDVFRETKNNSIQGEVNRNFSLLGDPSMRINFPSEKIEVYSINGEAPEDFILKSGEVYSLMGGTGDKTFFGTALISIFDKAVQKSTLGNSGNSKMGYTEISNLLFQGKAEVVNGEFQIDIRLTQNIAEGMDYGQIYLYAVNKSNGHQAIGGFDKVLISDEREQNITDHTPPEVTMNYNQETGILTILTFDESGVNVSSLTPEHNISLFVNDTIEYILNDDFQAINLTDGKIEFFLPKLTSNRPNTIQLKISDIYNNQTTEAFTITPESEEFETELTRIYPNISEDILNILFSHNKAGEELNIRISVYDLNGKELYYELTDCRDCPEELRFGMNLDEFLTANGKYFVKIVTGLNGQKGESVVSAPLLFWK
ncbi:type IX secretion system sortase PorU [Jiulongibacter sediminis]|uniref:Gingipain domain-containing protein n=1 Tax=Jiulongibacter sediminis TaxID=1605367 RepID=A0A0P7C8I3_9BACT|nr:type IX secretion system sortase PorU [Jiulongibacter sediminis]KPM48842.1 hypothetical protein AFM12_09745 [Jiulongibacter sediminis]TBX25373.1 hypothetical protein TK44_09750 [Jiulongibacter sediminis]